MKFSLRIIVALALAMGLNACSGTCGSDGRDLAGVCREDLLRETDRYEVYYQEDSGGTVVIDKSNGQIFDRFLKRYRLNGLQPLLWEGLSEALGEDDMDILHGYAHTKNGVIQLPERSLRPVEGGLVFEYQDGELVSCVGGEVEFTILNEDLWPFLTRKAKKLLDVPGAHGSTADSCLILSTPERI